MRSVLLDRLRSFFRKSSKESTAVEDNHSTSESKDSEASRQIQNPVHNFYQHKLRTNLHVFSRFALQTQSLIIRDVFAHGASNGQQGIADLLATLESCDSSELFDFYNTEILLALADLLANSSRGDLDTHAALKIYDFVHKWSASENFRDHQKLQYVEALGEADRYADLVRIAPEFSLDYLAPLQYELINIQRIRKKTSLARYWVEALNELYISLNMSEVRLSGDEILPLMDQLGSNATERIDGPKVSVIMPTFSPEPGIRTAIRSLLEQTWHNIEIIIVDDASPEEYQHLFSELEALDSRIQVIRQEKNAGAYVARNSGLSVATGDFVIAHDDDDWSHPDKIALQAGFLVRNQTSVATTSAHIRSTQDMYFQRVNTHARYVQMNYSSLMFRRAITDEIGPWDTVNRGGDSELLTRVIENFGADNVTHLLDKPLSFSRVWAGSLTSGEMFRGFFAYSRLLYRWSFRQWHWDMSKTGQKAIRKPANPRPYAVPTTFEPGDRNKDLGLFDVIYVTDYFRQSKFVNFVMNDIEALEKHGFRVGFMHVNSPQTNSPAGFPPRLFQLQREGRITQVSHDDIAETRLLIVYDAAIGMFADQLRSSVLSRRSVVIHHELPVLSDGEDRSASTMGMALGHLDRVFDSISGVVGATKADQDRLRNHVPNSRLLDDNLIWTPHLSEEPGTIAIPNSQPVVGFHTYGNQYRWPSNSEIFENVYISGKYKTRLFGSLEPGRKKFGSELIDQVETIDGDHLDEPKFLNSIDFWVYFPHHRLQDQLWGPVLSAMQAGKVVILPERLHPLYGPGAVYAASNEVADIVSRFTHSSELYVEHATQGQEFVRTRYSDGGLVHRILDLMV